MNGSFEMVSLSLPLAQEAQPSVPGMPGGGGAAPGTTGQPGTNAPAGGAPVGGGGGLFFLPLIAVMFILMIFLSGRAQRAEKKKKQALLSSLKKHDRVQTIGGLLGTISEIRDDEVVLRVDDANNTRLHFAKSAIQQVVRPAAGSKPDAAETDEADLSAPIHS